MNDQPEHRFAKQGGPNDPDELWLQEMLAQEPLEDDGFTQIISDGLDRERRKRRANRAFAWAAAWIGALLIGALLATVDLPSADVLPAGAQTLEGHHTLALALLSLGLISALWLDTESFGLEI